MGRPSFDWQCLKLLMYWQKNAPRYADWVGRPVLCFGQDQLLLKTNYTLATR
jgi:hypothetical protein